MAGVLLNGGAGTFSGAADFPVGASPAAVVVGKFTTSGNDDIASISSSGALDVLTGNGDGTFAADQQLFTTQLGTVGPQAVAGDFNGDGKADIVFLSTSGGGFGLITGSGSVTPPPVTTPASVIVPAFLTAQPTTPFVAGGKIKPIHEKLTLTDTSAATFDNGLTLDLLLSTGTVASANDPSLATFTRKKFRLKAHKSMTVSLTIKSLPATANGSYHILAQIKDATGAVSVTPSAATLSVLPGFHDLSGSFTKVPPLARTGRHANVSFTISNAGNLAVTGPLEVQAYLSKNGLIDSNAIVLEDVMPHVSIKPGKTVRMRLGKTITASAGSYFVIVRLDPKGVYPDSNVANNTFVSVTPVAVS